MGSKLIELGDNNIYFKYDSAVSRKFMSIGIIDRFDDNREIYLSINDAKELIKIWFKEALFNKYELEEIIKYGIDNLPKAIKNTIKYKLIDSAKNPDHIVKGFKVL